MNGVSASVFVIIGLSQIFTAHSQSPCPDIFEYASDDNGVYGIITLIPDGRKTRINIRTNFTITAKLYSNYVGDIKPYGGTNAILEYNRGKTIRYRVNLPVSSPLPKITALYVNNELVCSGDPDTLDTADYVTTITLQHTMFMESGPANVIRPTNTFKRPTTQVIKYNTNNGNNMFDDTTSKTTYFFDTENGIPVRNRITVPPRQPQGQISDRWREPESRPRPEKEENTRPARPPARQPETTYQNDYNTPNVQCGKPSQVPLIYHGNSYSPGEWPWLVAIYTVGSRQLNFICSGSLISDRHVVTAAHCMTNKESTDIVVKLGVFNLEEWGGDVVIKKLQSAFVHERFNRTNLENDISLFTLEQTVQFNSNIRPICLWGPSTDLNRIVGHTGVVTGWGANEQGTGGHGDPRMLRLPIVSTKECRASKKDFHGLTADTTLCAGNRDGGGPCSGDSGGGLYVLDDGRWKLRGIVSHALASLSAEKRCNLEEFVVFTDAAKYTTWIQRHMQF